MPIVLILIGIFCAFCAFQDYDWFMNNSRARLFVAMFGRNGARGFYVVLGVVLAIAGVAFMGAM